MSDKVQIEITARDNASRQFKAVSDSATKLDTNLDKLSTTGGKLSKSGAAMGAAIGATIGILGDASRLAAESEASQARLTAAVEATGATYEEYADQLDAAGEAALDMAFDDEEAADALAKITTATGDANTAISDFSLVMDIARGRGIDLASASNIVIAAEQGRISSLKRLGIQLGENATSEEAIAALQKKYAGQAEAYAATSAGAYDKISNAIENQMERLGGLTGQLQPVLMMLPGLSAGFTAASSAIGSVGKAAMGARAAMAASSLAFMGPVGLVAGAVLAGAAIVKFSGILGSDYDNHLKEATASTKAFNDVLFELAQNDALTVTSKVLSDTFLSLTDSADGVQQGFEGFHEQLGELKSEAETVNLTFEKGADGFDIYVQGLTTAEVAARGMSQAQIDSVNALGPANEAFDEQYLSVTELEAAYEATGNEIGRLNEQNALNAAIGSDVAFAMQEEGAAAAELQTKITNVILAHEAGNFSTKGAIIVIGRLVDEYKNATVAAADLGVELNELNAIVVTGMGMGDAAVDARMLHEGLASLGRSAGAARVAEEERTAATIAALGPMREVTEEAEAQAVAFGTLGNGLSDLSSELTANAAAMKTMTDMAGTGLGAAFQAIVGGTNAIGQQSQAVATWMTEFQALPGTIVDLETYADVQRENMEIQGHILDIQEKQAPVIADALEQQENYVQSLADMEAPQQRIALGWMDQAEAARATELATLAASDANQELIDNALIGAANADPVLAAMLEDMQLIGQGEEGYISLDTADAESDLDRLTVSIDNLVQAYEIDLNVDINGDGQIGPLKGALEDVEREYDPEVTLVDSASAGLRSVQRDFNNIVRNYNPTIGVIDNASGAISNVAQALSNLAGRVSNSYINTYATTYYSTVGPHMLGGVVGHADGGIVARMAEVGPELLHFQGGGMGMAYHDGLYNVPRGTYVTPAPATRVAEVGSSSRDVHITGPVYLYPATPDVHDAIYAQAVRGTR